MVHTRKSERDDAPVESNSRRVGAFLVVPVWSSLKHSIFAPSASQPETLTPHINVHCSEPPEEQRSVPGAGRGPRVGSDSQGSQAFTSKGTDVFLFFLKRRPLQVPLPSGCLAALEPLGCLLSEAVALLKLQDLPSLGTGRRLWANGARPACVPHLLPCSAAPAMRADPPHTPACLRAGSPAPQPSCGQLPL